MRPIIYDVAVSLDGYIAAPGGDASAFPHEGDHIAPYLDRLQTYGTVVMGRATYEFGYAFGLKPGARAYPHMDHHIFSTALDLPEPSDVTLVREGWLDHIDKLKSQPGAPIYLCGGGLFAGFLARHHRVDELRLKRCPFTYGEGVPLFAGLTEPAHFTLTGVARYDCGVLLESYKLA